MEDHHLILCSRAEYALIMIDYHLAIPSMVNQKPVMFQDTSHNLYALYYTLSGEKNLIKCRFIISINEKYGVFYLFF